MSEINEIIRKRWSPRAFSNKALTREQVDFLFEAARWAPSSMNEQPWRYYYASSEEKEKFTKILDCLVPWNRQWAQNAPLLIVGFAKKMFDYKGRPNRYAMHDTGASNMLIALQATAMGLQAHQMGGFDMEKTLRAFNLDGSEYEPASIIAVGYEGDPSTLPEDLVEREKEPRSRKPVSEFLNTNN